MCHKFKDLSQIKRQSYAHAKLLWQQALITAALLFMFVFCFHSLDCGHTGLQPWKGFLNHTTPGTNRDSIAHSFAKLLSYMGDLNYLVVK